MEPTEFDVTPTSDGARATRRRWIGVEVVAIALAASIGGLLGWRARSASDDSTPVGAAPQATTTIAELTVATTSAAPAVDPATTAPATSLAPTTTVGAPAAPVAPSTTTTSTTTSTTTTSTTTTLPPIVEATDDRLLAALPTIADAPGGWVVEQGSEPDTGLEPGEGRGICGGPDYPTRALEFGATGHAATPWFETTKPTWHYVSATGFASVDGASAFLADALQRYEACPEGYTEQLPEGDGDDGTWDGFADDLPATWSLATGYTFGEFFPEGVDGAFMASAITTAQATVDGVGYGSTTDRIVIYERVGSIVMAYGSWAQYGYYGYWDAADPGHDLQPPEALEVADHFRPFAIEGLQEQGLIVTAG